MTSDLIARLIASGTPADLVAEVAMALASAQRAVANTKGKRLDPDWSLPDDWRDWAMAERNWSASEVLAEAEQFRDYWTGKPGKDGTKLDWRGTWRNWVRNSRRANGTGPRVVDATKWTAERRAEYARKVNTKDDAATRAMGVRPVADLIQRIGRAG